LSSLGSLILLPVISNILFLSRKRLLAMLGVRENELRGLKTEQSDRKVPLEPELIEELKIHKLNQIQDLKEGQNPHRLVFTSEIGTPINPSNIDRRILSPALTLAGLKKVRWHDLRHSYATALISAGEPLAYVSKKLGHANPAITLKVYAHVLPETEENEHERLKEIFSCKIAPLAVH
jgi:integrase